MLKRIEKSDKKKKYRRLQKFVTEANKISKNKIYRKTE